MQRRKFLTSTLTASTLAAAAPAGFLQSAPPQATSSDGKGREFYQLRCYHLSSGPQRKLCDDFFRDALIPALNRLAITPVGVFDLSIGPETPSIYVLMPSLSLDTLVNVETRLAQDAEYLKTGAPFLTAPATAPAFTRMESSLLQAFERTPRLKLPPATATKGPRIFELRTYESPSDQDHKRKIEMMDVSEGEIFDKAGFFQVFYGDTLVGSRLPNLTYMISCENMAERDKKWAAFRDSAAWKSLSSQPRYAFEAIVSNITNVILAPTAYSQI
jgi:NIPSNAP protein